MESLEKFIEGKSEEEILKKENLLELFKEAFPDRDLEETMENLLHRFGEYSYKAFVKIEEIFQKYPKISKEKVFRYLARYLNGLADEKYQFGSIIGTMHQLDRYGVQDLADEKYKEARVLKEAAEKSWAKAIEYSKKE